MSWKDHEINFVKNYLKTKFWDNSYRTLFSDKRGYVWPATWSDLKDDYDPANIPSDDCSYCRFRGIWKWQNHGEWNVQNIDFNAINNGNKLDGFTSSLNGIYPNQTRDSNDNYNSGDDRTNFIDDSNSKRYPLGMTNGIEKSNYIPGYTRISQVSGSSSSGTYKFLISDRGDGYWKQAFVLYKKKNDKDEFANEIYNLFPKLVENIIKQIYYQNTGYLGENCKNKDTRFGQECKDLCNFSSQDNTILNNCNSGLNNYSSYCINGNQRYSDNCKAACDKGLTDETLIKNCNYGIAQWCNDDYNFKVTANFTRCENSILNYTEPYGKFRDTCMNSANLEKSFCTTYLNNDAINKKFYKDIDNLCDMNKYPNNYSKCKGMISKRSNLGSKFVTYCLKNKDSVNCDDLLNSDDNLKKKYDNAVAANLTSIADDNDELPISNTTTTTTPTPTTPTSTPTATTTTTTTPTSTAETKTVDDSKKDYIDTNTIIIIAVSVAVGLAILTGGLYYRKKRRRRSRNNDDIEDENIDEDENADEENDEEDLDNNRVNRRRNRRENDGRNDSYRDDRRNDSYRDDRRNDSYRDDRRNDNYRDESRNDRYRDGYNR
jgi:hypothetical protein